MYTEWQIIMNLSFLKFLIKLKKKIFTDSFRQYLILYLFIKNIKLLI